jgi:exopolysaccharide biosynthesis polyprenyl glycosylphosphotransferase
MSPTVDATKSSTATTPAPRSAAGLRLLARHATGLGVVASGPATDVEPATDPTVATDRTVAADPTAADLALSVVQPDLDVVSIPEPAAARPPEPHPGRSAGGDSGPLRIATIDPFASGPHPMLSTGPIAIDGRPVDGVARWLPRYVAALVGLDVLALALGGLVGQLVRFDGIGGDIQGIGFGAVLLAVAPAWVLMLAGSRAYEGRCLGLGSEEFRRVGNAAARFTAMLAIAVFLLRWDVARGLVVAALPSSSLFALLFRYLARQLLHRVRADGSASHRVLLVGEGRSRDVLAAKLQSSPHSGLRVVGVCRPVLDDGRGRPSVEHVRRAVRSLGADTVAVAHSARLTPEVLRRVAWSLEGTGVDLLVAPALTDVAGPRIHVRPVSGLPLLQIDEPEFTGMRRLVKGAIDVLGATALVLVFSPLLLVAAALVRGTSRGPVFFTQIRVGRDGRPFRMIKFRSMHEDAEQRLAELQALNDHAGGVLFKMRDDPRVTRIGRILRRYSIDELPQLFNVLVGQMSLVGPRPPLPEEVARYERDVHRRLLVKPGMTGLWQVSGRSDLNWRETVRLDLFYVENWSVALDAEILWKTLSAVVRGSGAR